MMAWLAALWAKVSILPRQGKPQRFVIDGKETNAPRFRDKYMEEHYDREFDEKIQSVVSTIKSSKSFRTGGGL
jgi:hypothetical protein